MITNSNCFRILACVICAIVLIGCGAKESEVAGPKTVLNSNSNDIQAVQSDVRRLVYARYSGDVDSALVYAHPKIIESMGGADHARGIFTNMFLRFQASGTVLESVTFPAEPVFLKSDLHRFALVPTRNNVIVGGQRIESVDYQVGVMDTGATNWTYIEGSRINSTNVNKFFPDFPANVRFPDSHRKKL